MVAAGPAEENRILLNPENVVCGCVCAWVTYTGVQVLVEARGVGSPGLGVTGDYESASEGIRN